MFMRRARLVFMLACVFMGAYMTVTQSVGFLENRDSSTISYNHFNQDPKDQYPTFSICFEGTAFHWYNEQAIFKRYGLTSYNFQRMMKGDASFGYEYDGKLRLFKKRYKRKFRLHENVMK